MGHIRVTDRKLIPHPTYGDLFTMDDFRDMVINGSFIDYDGHGRWATEKEMFPYGEENMVYPSTFLKATPPAGATHVIWFNR